MRIRWWFSPQKFWKEGLDRNWSSFDIIPHGVAVVSRTIPDRVKLNWMLPDVVTFSQVSRRSTIWSSIVAQANWGWIVCSQLRDKTWIRFSHPFRPGRLSSLKSNSQKKKAIESKWLCKRRGTGFCLAFAAGWWQLRTGLSWRIPLRGVSAFAHLPVNTLGTFRSTFSIGPAKFVSDNKR
jgi:hypothetical protein